MQSRNSSLKLRKAFTLIELAVVAALIAVMAAMIIPEMKGTFDDALLRSTGRDLINSFSLASSRAVSFNQLCRVHLDKQNSRFVLERESRSDASAGFVPLTDVPGAEGRLDPRISIKIRQSGDDSSDSQEDDSTGQEASADAVAFYPDGTADAVDIQLLDRSGYEMTLFMNPVTSRVHVTGPERK